MPNRSADERRWRRYLADERAEAAVYRNLAARRTGEEREILLALEAAEVRHASHWEALLGDGAQTVGPTIRTRLLGWLALRFGSIFVLALAQQAESRSPYANDPDATQAMAADERIHGEVVRGLLARARITLSGHFRAAVFGMNDGLVSNLALILGMAGAGVDSHIVLLTGIAGLLAGALSMAAGEYVSVRSQRELLAASAPDPTLRQTYAELDLEANELALVYRARGMSADDADEHAAAVLARVKAGIATHPDLSDGGHSHAPHPTEPSTFATVTAASPAVEHEAVGTAIGAAAASFCFFAIGALMPIVPFLFGLGGMAAVVVALVIVGVALLITGAAVGVLSGVSPVWRGLRQLTIGFGAAAATYLLGLVFGATLG
ncbi:MAG TPA: VIT1/CCC1 family protein [Candidatus Lumbricidophila sp.]|nr:VIT1/CCC1 family protein [Candidatus Lumbricidophila sp.]